MVPVMLSGCAAYKLSDKNPQYMVTKHAEATKGTCGVVPFEYKPMDKGDSKLMVAADLSKWDQLFFDAVNTADICGKTVRVSSKKDIPASVDYLIDGQVNEFYFKKNWVPMFFPGYLGLTFITLGVYAIAAGPTTSTMVDFGFTANLRNAKTGLLIESIPEEFKSKDVMTMYSDDNDNPYGNPGLAFEPTINDVTHKLGEAIKKVEADKPKPSSGDVIGSLHELNKKGLLSDEEFHQKLKQVNGGK